MISIEYGKSDFLLSSKTTGSQEGAFENVRMSYTGENGQTIRQLMSTHKLRRVAMCCLASPHGRRQHLAVSHEKGSYVLFNMLHFITNTSCTRRVLLRHMTIG